MLEFNEDLPAIVNTIDAAKSDDVAYRSDRSGYTVDVEADTGTGMACINTRSNSCEQMVLDQWIYTRLFSLDELSDEPIKFMNDQEFKYTNKRIDLSLGQLRTLVQLASQKQHKFQVRLEHRPTHSPDFKLERTLDIGATDKPLSHWGCDYTSLMCWRSETGVQLDNDRVNVETNFMFAGFRGNRRTSVFDVKVDRFMDILENIYSRPINMVTDKHTAGIFKSRNYHTIGLFLGNKGGVVEPIHDGHYIFHPFDMSHAADMVHDSILEDHGQDAATSFEQRRETGLFLLTRAHLTHIMETVKYKGRPEMLEFDKTDHLKLVLTFSDGTIIVTKTAFKDKSYGEQVAYMHTKVPSDPRNMMIPADTLKSILGRGRANVGRWLKQFKKNRVRLYCSETEMFIRHELSGAVLCIRGGWGFRQYVTLFDKMIDDEVSPSQCLAEIKQGSFMYKQGSLNY